MIVELMLSGFLFLFILILTLVMGLLGYSMEGDDYEPDADLQKISKNPKKFQTSMILAFIHNGCVIALPILLFIAFSHYNLILGIVWTIFRIGEGTILFINDKNYWGFLNIARQYSDSSGDEKKALSDSARNIFKTKDYRFKIAIVCWSIGTFAFSIVIVTSDVVPTIIGWLGIVASILVGFYNGIKLVKPSYKGPLNLVGGLSAIIFEIIIGGWLLFYPLI
ncbi:MAG: DUF4386 domain-containing protein [Thermoplasmata archaeon]|nr:MAG: DUF4386 domain-containing protein [Thermoplasmata archaeon]